VNLPPHETDHLLNLKQEKTTWIEKIGSTQMEFKIEAAGLVLDKKMSV
jgi:hypothetical protein